MKPLILNYQTERNDADDGLPFQYDFESSMNVVASIKGKIPFIEAESAHLQLNTQTRQINPEREQEPHLASELTTSTKVARERENEAFSLLELQTKTFKKREQDE